MRIRRAGRGRERGVALAYTAITLILMMVCTGLAIDLGRGYIVRIALTKAVDGAALAAARAIPQGHQAATRAAANIFNVNFPTNYLGVSSLQNPPKVTFDVDEDGSDLITVSSNATIPNTFMRVAGYDHLTVANSAEATRRLIDLSFVVDRSGSLSGVYSQVKSAAQQFVNYFDQTNDRMSLVMFSTNTVVMDTMGMGRGFNRNSINGHIQSSSSNGNTGTPDGLYKGWDQLRGVPADNQSGLRIIVLFTDGAPNTFGGDFRLSTTCPSNRLPASPVWVIRQGVIRTGDFASGDSADDSGLYVQYGTTSQTNSPISPTDGNNWHSGSSTNRQLVNPCIPNLPVAGRSHHTGTSSGIPSGFPFYDGSLPRQRPMVGSASPNGYPNHVQNANNAARNLTEIIADEIRDDTSGKARIRILTLGLGNLLNANQGMASETGASILKRVANDPTSPDFNPTQVEGKYFFAGSASELQSAFEAIRDLIIRLSS